MQGYKKTKTVTGKTIRDVCERGLFTSHRNVQDESVTTRHEGNENK